MDLNEIHERHNARLAGLDPLLPVPGELTEELLVTATAAGALRTDIEDPDAYGALWGATERHRLIVRLADDDLDPLLDAWEERLRKEVSRVGDPEVAAMINWPTRDVAAVRSLTTHGFAPLVATAVRRAHTPAASGAAPDVTVRAATVADVDVCVELFAMITRYDTQFGVVTERPSMMARLREKVDDLLGRDRECIWLAERSGAPVGVLAADLGQHADWVAGSTSAPSVAYIGMAGVADGERGSGVGTALVEHGHRIIDSTGAAVTLLHHALPNPRSTPFWYRNGYRPLWTLWQRRPAIPG